MGAFPADAPWGQWFISAYNIEDNELWTRHIVTALSQVVVALYVFCKSWSFSADDKLLAAAILIFIPGILKCFRKPWVLKYASFRSLSDSFDLAKRTAAANRETELQKYVQEARNFVLYNNKSSNLDPIFIPRMLFADFQYPYSSRLAYLIYFFLLSDIAAFSSVQEDLSEIFDDLYTKVTRPTKDGHTEGRRRTTLVAMLMSLLLPIVAIVLFHISHKKAYRRDDVAVTYILSYSSVVLELSGFIIMVALDGKWHATVSQRSILVQFANNKRHSKLMSLATQLRCKGLFDQYWSMESCHSAQNITMLVRRHVQDGWKDYISDAESYTEFNDIRGQWTLEREACHSQLNWSLEKPFDESILIWHIATDLCFHHMDKVDSRFERFRGYQAHKQAVTSVASSQTCREMSNYMMHLLVTNPEMLMPGSRRSLFAIAYSELEAHLEGVEDPLMRDDKVAEQLIEKVKSARDTNTNESLIDDAWVLAKGLMDLGGEKMWKVIQGVWVEMLCFSAGRCRGFLHAKALGTGGEFISYVWLTLAYSGMETFPERLQRTKNLHLLVEKRKHLQTGGHDVAGPSASQGTEEESTAALPTSQGDGYMDIVVS